MKNKLGHIVNIRPYGKAKYFKMEAFSSKIVEHSEEQSIEKHGELLSFKILEDLDPNDYETCPAQMVNHYDYLKIYGIYAIPYHAFNKTRWQIQSDKRFERKNST